MPQGSARFSFSSKATPGTSGVCIHYVGDRMGCACPCFMRVERLSPVELTVACLRSVFVGWAVRGSSSLKVQRFLEPVTKRIMVSSRGVRVPKPQSLGCFYVLWQRGIKIANGIKDASHLTLRWGCYLDNPGGLRVIASVLIPRKPEVSPRGLKMLCCQL